ncbi:MAG: hypothetical protein A2139_14905 [Desulfobacca sp. RBG_16_60_12]|nr:MAG: hypothetical protein A2139_14905 [Desulfobacca sp. RBG_16_60_12]
MLPPVMVIDERGKALESRTIELVVMDIRPMTKQPLAEEFGATSVIPYRDGKPLSTGKPLGGSVVVDDMKVAPMMQLFGHLYGTWREVDEQDGNKRVPKGVALSKVLIHMTGVEPTNVLPFAPGMYEQKARTAAIHTTRVAKNEIL